MGHYDEQYQAMYDARAKRDREERERKAAEQAKRTAKLKAQYPNTPSKWEISLDERVKMLEDQMNIIAGRLGG